MTGLIHAMRPIACAALLAGGALTLATPSAAGETVRAAETVEGQTLCSWSFGRWSTNADGALVAEFRARAVATDGRILAYRLRDDVDSEALLLDLSAGLGGGVARDSEHWIVEDAGPSLAPEDVARIAAHAEDVRDGALEETSPSEPYANVGLELLTCTIVAVDGGDGADGADVQIVTLLITGDTLVTNRHPRAAALAEELAAILDVGHMLTP